MELELEPLSHQAIGPSSQLVSCDTVLAISHGNHVYALRVWQPFYGKRPQRQRWAFVILITSLDGWLSYWPESGSGRKEVAEGPAPPK